MCIHCAATIRRARFGRVSETLPDGRGRLSCRYGAPTVWVVVEIEAHSRPEATQSTRRVTRLSRVRDSEPKLSSAVY